MPTGTRTCKVCGKEYPYCKTAVASNIFRYQDVACCPEHGSIYFSLIEESRRGGLSPADNQPPVPEAVDTNEDLPDEIVEDEDEGLFEDDEDDEEDFYEYDDDEDDEDL